MISNTASLDKYLPTPILLPFFFLPPTRAALCLGGRPALLEQTAVSVSAVKACFSGVYYSVVKMRSRQKTWHMKAHLRGNWWGFFLKKNLFSFYRRSWEGREEGQEFTVGNCGFLPHGFSSSVCSVLFLISSNQIFGGPIIEAVIPGICSLILPLTNIY